MVEKEYDIRNRTLAYSIQIVKLFQTNKVNNFIEQIIIKQLIRSATSIGANVQEARGASSTRDYQNYFRIALKSANETKYWLQILLQTSDFQPHKVKDFLSEAEEITKIIASCILKMK